MMKILIAGASGFIGKQLTSALINQHQLTVLGRDSKYLENIFPKAINKISWHDLSTLDAKLFDAIINLCGTNISEKKWTKKVKKDLIESRTTSNQQLISWLIAQNVHPHYYCANAVGIYGAHETDHAPYDENSFIDMNHVGDFLQQIGLAWEASLAPAVEQGIKVTTLRFGVVLKKGEGMLQKLELPFSLGLGSTFGTGNQMISWIHYQDVVNAILFLLAHPDVTGPINITAPHSVSQQVFAMEFAKTLHRPIFLKTPAWLIKTLFGEMGDLLLLKGQHVVPNRLFQLGFKFSYPNLTQALKREMWVSGNSKGVI